MSRTNLSDIVFLADFQLHNFAFQRFFDYFRDRQCMTSFTHPDDILIDTPNQSVSLYPLLNHYILTRIKLLKPTKIHLPLKQWLHIRIKSLPVRIVQVILLTLIINLNQQSELPFPPPCNSSAQTTYRLLLISLHNRKVPRIMHTLHDEP